MITHLEDSFFVFPLFYTCSVQDFPLLKLDDIVDDQSNIVGFSMFNTTHPFYLEFIRSLNLSWREGCDLTYPGPAVSLWRLPLVGVFGVGGWSGGGEGGMAQALAFVVQEIISKALLVCRDTLSCFIAHPDQWGS